jgi:hypothetical protein
MIKVERYLGDGLYASFDGFMITLRAPREHGEHWVGLEPQVFAELLRFLEEDCAISFHKREPG